MIKHVPGGRRPGVGRDELGAVVLAQGDLTQAENCYQKASIIRQELNQSHYLVEDWAELAKVKLAQGELESARSFAGKILDYLQENPSLIMSEHPMQTFRFTWDVWTALGEAAKADQVLALAADVIRDYLEKNPDPEAQAMYLRQPNHAVLWEAWQERKDD